MCGLSAFFAREAVPSPKVIQNLLHYGSERGSDAVGFVLISEELGYFEIVDSHKEIGIGNEKELAQRISKDMKVGDIVLINHRATPETESASTDSRSIQPVIDESHGIVLIHNGSVSSFVYDKLREKYEPKSDIDSEAIIWSYLEHGRNMKGCMEFLSGGFAFLLFDMEKEMLYAVATHNPLWAGYVRGYGMFFSSTEEGIYSTISLIKGTAINRNNIMVWEDYYCREIPAFSISEIEMYSGMLNEIKFYPRYVHPKYDPLEKRFQNRKILVCASGGLDSTTTLTVLKEAGYDVSAVHFKYSHRGQECEAKAISEICKILDVPCIVFDIESSMKQLDSDSMLTNPDHAITTGTQEDLKTTVAWTCFRNGFFVTYMGALAESLIINQDYGEVYIAGGFLNLTESGVYPDNSERFISAFSKFARFASIVGTRIKPLFACSNLLKTEQYILLDALGHLEKLSPWLISCDRPKMIDGVPHNCSKDGKPACGSGLLSWWATKYAGVEDYRKYYEVDDPEYIAFTPNSDLEVKPVSIQSILRKLQAHSINLKILHKKLLRYV